MIDISLGSLVNAAGGVLFMVLGAWVLSLRPKRPATTDFGLYALAFGFVFTPQNLIGPGSPEWWVVLMNVTSGLGGIPAVWALVRLASHFPAPLASKERRLLVIPAALAVAAASVLGVLFVALTFAGIIPPGPSELVNWSRLVLGLGTHGLLSSAVGITILLSLRFRRGSPGAAEFRGQCAFLATVTSLFPAFIWGGVTVTRGDVISQLIALVGMPMVIVAAGLWFANGVRGRDRTARNVALVVLAMALVGMVASSLVGGLYGLDESGAFGVVRTAEVLLLAYAILRMQMLGLDVKLRWTIQKSTVAAAFIGVFFVVSEGAQQVFSESLGPFVGIAAAGALVFAMAPLQRVAERVATAAVPAGEQQPTVRSRREERYKIALRIALRDGRLSDAERRGLAGLAEELGLGAGDYERLRLEVEAESSPRRARR